ncbi:MAG: uncharacterized protein A8A55_1680 [Amphiamblys sp. WSBS2006]|nr:MAG: uncharacterized protein A8A55_1680 [Amphiamblys sp. WSBS2006]
MVKKKPRDRRVLKRRQEKREGGQARPKKRVKKIGKKEKKRLRDDKPTSWPPADVSAPTPAPASGLAQKKSEEVKTVSPKNTKQLLRMADAVLELVDARDPLRSASNIENSIVLLTKTDLVPEETVATWKEHFGKTKETVAINLKDLYDTENGLHCVSQAVHRVTKKECATVAIVGYENTGRKTLLEELKRKAFRSENSVFVLPGLRVFSFIGEHKDTRPKKDAVLSGTGSFPKNPKAAAQHIIEHCGAEKLMFHYNLPLFSTLGEFVSLRKKQKTPNPERTLVQDWRNGNIRFSNI